MKSHLDGRTPLYESEHRLRTKSGQWIWVLDRGRVMARDAEGRPHRITGTHLDVTARKRADADLLESRANLEKSQDIARLANWVWEIASDRMSWSSTIYRMLEANPDDIGDTYDLFLGLIHPKDRERGAQGAGPDRFRGDDAGPRVYHSKAARAGGDRPRHGRGGLR